MEALLGNLFCEDAAEEAAIELRAVLLVEDDAKALEAALAALADLRLANPIAVARGASEARALLTDAAAPACVLLGLGSADSSALSLLAELQSDASTIPVLALAPAAAREGLRRAHPALQVVATPVRREALFAAIENLGLAWAVIDGAEPRGAYRPNTHPAA